MANQRPGRIGAVDILELAEQNILYSMLLVVSVGAVQGAVLGRGIRRRFPRLKAHARIVSVVLLVLFAANAVANTAKFAVPDKVSLGEMAMPETAGQWIDLAVVLLGLNTGFGAVLALFVSVTLVLVFRFAELPSVARYFVFFLGVITMLLAIIGRFTDYVPAEFEIVMYASYQAGITAGIFFVTARRSGPEEFE